MTFSERYGPDKDKMKKCMFGMPIEKDELPCYYMTGVDTTNGMTWTLTTANEGVITVGGWYEYDG